MLPNEISDLVQPSIFKLFGEGEVSMETSSLRPQKLDSVTGMNFDLSAELSDGPNYHGLMGAFIAEGKLYLITFLGAEPYYFNKHRQVAETLIKSARPKTG